MKYFQLTFLFALIIFLGLFRVVDASDPDSPVPNVIIFYVDDLGWQDIELNDLDDPCPYETPNIKRLASSGDEFHSSLFARANLLPLPCRYHLGATSGED